ncbi:MAG TPA: MBL fold metallo-hydrolase [Bacillota bacterium]|nr:MBL fold metallo-hydrolase [Bacillota bacterium]
MFLKTLVVSMFGTNCYLVGCSQTKEGVVIDPGAEGKRIIKEIKEAGIKIKFIINTHGHVDHIGANSRLKEALGAPVLLHRRDLEIYQNPGFGLGLVVGKQPQPDRFIKEGDRINFGRLSLQVIETPGHTPGGVSLYMPGAVFSGDTLFAGSIGRTDLAGGSFHEIIQSIKKRLLVLPPDTVVYPGHGPASTIGDEARSNPFVCY